MKETFFCVRLSPKCVVVPNEVVCCVCCSISNILQCLVTKLFFGSGHFGD